MSRLSRFCITTADSCTRRSLIVPGSSTGRMLSIQLNISLYSVAVDRSRAIEASSVSSSGWLIQALNRSDRPPRRVDVVSIVRDGKVLLLRNERDEWKLPGGQLEIGEDPPDLQLRRIAEECGWSAAIGPILDAWQYHIRDGLDCLIVTYAPE